MPEIPMRSVDLPRSDLSRAKPLLGYEYGTTAEGVIERANILARALLYRYGAAPQGGEDADPVAWRHSKTLSLYETEEEVPLADGNEWAEPLCLCDRPQPAGRDAREVPDET